MLSQLHSSCESPSLAMEHPRNISGTLTTVGTAAVPDLPLICSCVFGRIRAPVVGALWPMVVSARDTPNAHRCGDSGEASGPIKAPEPALPPRRVRNLGMAAGFRSNFAPPDTGPPGTGGNRQGRRAAADAIHSPFVLVTGGGRNQPGMGRDLRGATAATCKIAGIAYTGSNPVPATLPLSCGNAVAAWPARRACGVWIPSGFPPPDTLPTPSAHPAPPAEHPRARLLVLDPARFGHGASAPTTRYGCARLLVWHLAPPRRGIVLGG
jgi:hypothetical protein